MAYADRKNTLTKEDQRALLKQGMEPRRRIQKISEERRKLWSALESYIREHGGKAVSIPGHSPMRIETHPDSDIPLKLRNLGYNPIHAEQVTTFTGKGFEKFNIVLIDLPPG